MISDDRDILYIKPSARTSSDPTIDDLTRKMTSAFRQGEPVRQWRGFHNCPCGVRSDNTDYRLPDGKLTNSLCVHYLAWHRREVPSVQLEQVAALNVEPVDPTPAELVIPPGRLFGG